MNYPSLRKHLFLALLLMNFSTTLSTMNDILHRLEDPNDEMADIESQIEEFI